MSGRASRRALRIVGWLLTPLVAWAVAFLGAWAGALVGRGVAWLVGGAIVGALLGAAAWTWRMWLGRPRGDPPASLPEDQPPAP